MTDSASTEAIALDLRNLAASMRVVHDYIDMDLGRTPVPAKTATKSSRDAPRPVDTEKPLPPVDTEKMEIEVKKEIPDDNGTQVSPDVDTVVSTETETTAVTATDEDTDPNPRARKKPRRTRTTPAGTVSETQ